MQITVSQVAELPVWTVSRPDWWQAVASIRQARDGAFDVVGAKIEKFPEAVEFEMDGFRKLEHAEQWCREIAAKLWK